MKVLAASCEKALGTPINKIKFFTNQDVILELDEEEEEITGSIRVYVRDSETNALISGATVSGAGSTKTTNSSGYTTFSSLSLGTYSFTASKTGYESGSIKERDYTRKRR